MATAKKKPRGNPWKPGQSGNPKGAPKRGESWAEIIKRVGDLTPHEAAQSSLELAKQFLKIGEGVTLKEAVVLRVYGALLFEPNPGLLNAFMNRVEGMPTQAVDVTSGGHPVKAYVTISPDDWDNESATENKPHSDIQAA